MPHHTIHMPATSRNTENVLKNFFIFITILTAKIQILDDMDKIYYICPIFFRTFAPQNDTIMTHKTTLKIYEWLSYILLLGATVVYFILKSRAVGLVMAILVLAVFARLMMERTRYKACEEENDQLKDDLRRLTLLLAEEKKKNQK